MIKEIRIRNREILVLLSVFCIREQSKMEKRNKKFVKKQQKSIKMHVCEKKNNIFYAKCHAKCVFDN